MSGFFCKYVNKFLQCENKFVFPNEVKNKQTKTNNKHNLTIIYKGLVSCFCPINRKSRNSI